MVKALIAAFGVAAVVVTTAAEAATLTWTFQDATFQGETFSEPATVTGSFDFDADTNIFSNANILIAGVGDVIAGVDFNGTYDQRLMGGSMFASLLKSGDGPDFTDDPRIDINWGDALTNAGGVVTLNTISLWKCVNANCLSASGSTSLTDMTLNGSLTATPAAVPLPAAGLLFLSALGALWGLRRWRQDGQFAS